MKLLPVKTLPEGDQWLYELEFDGFRSLIVKTAEKIQIWSRNRNDLASRFPNLSDAGAVKFLEITKTGYLRHAQLIGFTA